MLFSKQKHTHFHFVHKIRMKQNFKKIILQIWIFKIHLNDIYYYYELITKFIYVYLQK